MGFHFSVSHGTLGDVEITQDGEDAVFTVKRDARVMRVRFSDFMALMKYVQRQGIAATPFAAGHIAGALARAAFEARCGDELHITKENVEQMVRQYLPRLLEGVATKIQTKRKRGAKA